MDDYNFFLPIQEFSQKHPSSFRMHANAFIILKLQTEGCFRHLSAMFHFLWKRTENQSAENEKLFGLDWKIVWRRAFDGFLP